MRPSRSNPIVKSSGFTFVEFLVGMAIIIIMALVGAKLIGMSMFSVLHQTNSVKASNFARTLVDEVRGNAGTNFESLQTIASASQAAEDDSDPSTSWTIHPGTQTVTSGTGAGTWGITSSRYLGMSATREIGPIQNNGVRNITVTVNWQENGGPRIFRLTAQMVKNSQDAGGGVVTGRVEDPQTSTGIPDAEVKGPSFRGGDTPPVLTNASGEFELRGVAYGDNIRIEISKLGTSDDPGITPTNSGFEQGYYSVPDAGNPDDPYPNANDAYTYSAFRSVSVSPQDPEENVGIVPLHRLGSIIGVVTDEANGNLLSGVRVRLFTKTSDQPTIPKVFEKETGADGSYAFHNVMPGYHALRPVGRPGTPSVNEYTRLIREDMMDDPPSPNLGAAGTPGYVRFYGDAESSVPVAHYVQVRRGAETDSNNQGQPGTTHWALPKLGDIQVTLTSTLGGPAPDVRVNGNVSGYLGLSENSSDFAPNVASLISLAVTSFPSFAVTDGMGVAVLHNVVGHWWLDPTQGSPVGKTSSIVVGGKDTGYIGQCVERVFSVTDPNTVTMNLRPEAEAASIRGRVVDTDGNPLGDARITAEGIEPNCRPPWNPWGGVNTAYATSEPSGTNVGRFEIEKVMPSSGAGDPKTIRISYYNPNNANTVYNGRVHGQVQDQWGRHASRVVVSAGDVSERTQANGNGDYDLVFRSTSSLIFQQAYPLSAGMNDLGDIVIGNPNMTRNMDIVDPDYHSYSELGIWNQYLVGIPPNDPNGLELNMTAIKKLKANLSGRVMAPGNQAVNGAIVQFARRRANENFDSPVAQTTTANINGQDGRYVFPNPVALGLSAADGWTSGTLIVTVTAPGYQAQRIMETGLGDRDRIQDLTRDFVLALTSDGGL